MARGCEVRDPCNLYRDFCSTDGSSLPVKNQLEGQIDGWGLSTLYLQ
jgi:hypothetical protein